MAEPQGRQDVGRPPRPMLEPSPDTPENVERELMTSPPRLPDNWEDLKLKPVSDPASADESSA